MRARYVYMEMFLIPVTLNNCITVSALTLLCTFHTNAGCNTACEAMPTIPAVVLQITLLANFFFFGLGLTVEINKRLVICGDLPSVHSKTHF